MLPAPLGPSAQGFIVKLQFDMLDERGAIFEARIDTPEEQAAAIAFEDWCSQWLPPPGEHWSRLERSDLESRPMPLSAPVPLENEAASRRLLIVFGDHSLARRFRDAWC